ncbi:MAG TPA: hypothetical protein VFW69_12650, partial [Mycobacterium sp.]|nr:hypothetical protein [Mycobacterium sp.]
MLIEYRGQVHVITPARLGAGVLDPFPVLGRIADLGEVDYIHLRLYMHTVARAKGSRSVTLMSGQALVDIELRTEKLTPCRPPTHLLSAKPKTRQRRRSAKSVLP